MKKLLKITVGKALAVSVIAFTFSSPSSAQVSVSAFFGWNQTSIPGALINAVDAFQTGANTSNSIIFDGTANDFTLTFAQNLNVGTARFIVTDNYGTNLVGGNQVLRQFDTSIEGPNTSAGQLELTITLASITNLSSVSLSRVQVTGAGTANYIADLPSGVASSAYNSAISSLDGAWSLGQSLKIKNSSSTSAVLNVQGISLSATPIPEPSSAALLGGLIGLGLVALRRRRA